MSLLFDDPDIASLPGGDDWYTPPWLLDWLPPIATEAEAIAFCEGALERYRDEASDGWPEETDHIYYSEIKGRVVEVSRLERCPDAECDGECGGDVHHDRRCDSQIDYALKAV